MKGRFGYASFLDEPGIEKLLDFTEVKSSFLRPVTPCVSQREPFSLHNVVSLVGNGFPPSLSAELATAFSLAYIFLQGGLQSLQLSSVSSVVLAARHKEIP